MNDQGLARAPGGNPAALGKPLQVWLAKQ